MLLLGYLWATAVYTLPFLFVLTFLVFFHELGHYLIGRWCGVRVDAFSLGLGPKIFGFHDRNGTRWQLAALPLGGYVKFRGDASAGSAIEEAAAAAMPAHERAVSFFAQNLWKRAAIVAAGPITNFLLSVAIFTGLFYLAGRAILLPAVDTVAPGGAAEAAGVKPNDVIVAIAGTKIESFDEVQRVVQAATGGKELAITVNRGGKLVDLAATPERRDVVSEFGTSRIGVLGATVKDSPEFWQMRHFGFVDSVKLATSETWFIIAQAGGYLKGLLAGTETGDQLSGPIRVAEVSGAMAKMGVAPLLNLAAMLSISVGLLNLLPVPLLDGGHLFYYALEAIRGKALNQKAQQFGFNIGFALVAGLLFFATYNDVLRLARQWIQ